MLVPKLLGLFLKNKIMVELLILQVDLDYMVILDKQIILLQKMLLWDLQKL